MFKNLVLTTLLLLLTIHAYPQACLTITANGTDVSCSGGSDGSVTLTVTGGVTPYTYQWDNGETSNPATYLSAGTHIVTITDSDSCEATESVIVNAPTPITIQSLSSTPVSCFGGNDGTASITPSGGTPPYNYEWNTNPTQTGNTASGLTAGTYTVLITDANACALPPINVTVTQPDTPIFGNTNSVEPSCNGESDGSASIVTNGGTPAYTYSWSTGDSSPTTSGISAGIYTVTVTDANGCTFTDNVTIAEPAPIVTNVVSSGVDCFGDETGSILIENVSGGTGGPYIFSIDGVNFTASNFFGGLAGGNYTVFIQDANGCMEMTSILVEEADELILNVTSTPATMGNNGTATANASGGTPPYAYAWIGAQTSTAVASNLAPGVYTVQVTDVIGCTAESNIVVSDVVSINELENLADFSISPNPINGQFVVNLSFTTFENINISVVNALGQVMYEAAKSGIDFSLPIDLTTQAAGVYFVEISTKKGRVTKRVLKT